MDKTRSIRGRVFTQQNLLQIAEKVRELVVRQNGSAVATMSVTCTRSNGETNTTIVGVAESGNVDQKIFEGAGRLVSVLMHAHNDDAFAIHLSLTDGSGDVNDLRVDGDDDNRVTRAFQNIYDLIENAAPQGAPLHWVISRPFLIVLPLATLGVGQLLLRVARNNFSETVGVLSGWGQLGVVILAGLIPALPVTALIRWLFPRVELDVGPDHLKHNKTARRLFGGLIGIAIGILVGDLIKDLVAVIGTTPQAGVDGN